MLNQPNKTQKSFIILLIYFTHIIPVHTPARYIICKIFDIHFRFSINEQYFLFAFFLLFDTFKYSDDKWYKNHLRWGIIFPFRFSFPLNLTLMVYMENTIFMIWSGDIILYFKNWKKKKKYQETRKHLPNFNER